MPVTEVLSLIKKSVEIALKYVKCENKSVCLVNYHQFNNQAAGINEQKNTGRTTKTQEKIFEDHFNVLMIWTRKYVYVFPHTF